MSQYQNEDILEFIAAEDDGSSDDNLSYNTCNAPVKLLPPTNQQAAFYRLDDLSVAQPIVSLDPETLANYNQL